jgi:hypothetical protein
MDYQGHQGWLVPRQALAPILSLDATTMFELANDSGPTARNPEETRAARDRENDPRRDRDCGHRAIQGL